MGPIPLVSWLNATQREKQNPDAPLGTLTPSEVGVEPHALLVHGVDDPKPRPSPMTGLLCELKPRLVLRADSATWSEVLVEYFARMGPATLHRAMVELNNQTADAVQMTEPEEGLRLGVAKGRLEYTRDPPILSGRPCAAARTPSRLGGGGA